LLVIEKSRISRFVRLIDIEVSETCAIGITSLFQWIRKTTQGTSFLPELIESQSKGFNWRELHMIARVEAYQAAVVLLNDLPPYEQCQSIVQMVHDGSLTHEEGLELLYMLVDHEIDAPAQRH
jgi:hypothetical protein